MNIIYIIPGKSYSGAMKYVIQLCRYFHSQNIETSIICENPDLFSSIGFDCSIYQIDFSNMMIACKKVCKILSGKKDYILHNNTLDSMLLTAMVSLITHCKFVSTVHVVFEDDNVEKIKNDFIFQKDLNDVIYNGNIVAVSNAAKTSMIECGFNPDKISVIYNGIKNSSVVAKKKDPSKIRIGYLGRLNRVKSVHTLLEAFHLLKTDSRYEKMELMIVGDGPKRESLELLAKQYNINVIFTGYVENTDDYLSQFDMMVLPSYYEACPYVVMEAFNLRIPVIASNARGTNEMVSDQRNGLLFEIGDYNQLSKQIIYTLDHPEKVEEMKKNAYEDWANKYSYESFGKSYAQYYKNLMLQ